MSESKHPCVGCVCKDCWQEDCPQRYCQEWNRGYNCMVPDENCPEPFRPKKLAPIPPQAPAPAPPPPVIQEKEVMPLWEEGEPFNTYSLPKYVAEQLQEAENIIRHAKAKFIFDVAKAVHMAHEALCSSVGQQLPHGKGSQFVSPEVSFVRWCRSVGLSKTSAKNMIKVYEYYTQSTEEQKQLLEKANVNLLYEAARPSTPQALKEQVREGEIATLKELKELKTELRQKEEQLREAEKYESKFREENKQLKEELIEMKENMKEIQQRPVEVIVATDETAEQEHARLLEELEATREELERLQKKPSGHKIIMDKLTSMYMSLMSDLWDAFTDEVNGYDYDEQAKLYSIFRDGVMEILEKVENDISKY